MSLKVTTKELGELRQQEVELIFLIRNVYRFGEVTILTRDGLPQDVVKTVMRVRLGQLSTEDVAQMEKQFYNLDSK